jgi:hypothetical protein
MASTAALAMVRDIFEAIERDANRRPADVSVLAPAARVRGHEDDHHCAIARMIAIPLRSLAGSKGEETDFALRSLRQRG